MGKGRKMRRPSKDLNRDSNTYMSVATSSLQALFNIDVIWLMVLMLITMEISLLTPPFGLLLYVMMGVAPINVTTPFSTWGRKASCWPLLNR